MNSPQFENILNVILVQIPVNFFVDINEVILKSIWKGKGNRIVSKLN